MQSVADARRDYTKGGGGDLFDRRRGGMRAGVETSLNIHGLSRRQNSELKGVMDAALSESERRFQEVQKEKDRRAAALVFKNVELSGLRMEIGPDGGVSLSVDDQLVQQTAAAASLGVLDWFTSNDGTHIISNGGSGFRYLYENGGIVSATVPALTTGSVALPGTGETTIIAAGYTLGASTLASAGWFSGNGASAALALADLNTNASASVFLWPVAQYTESGGDYTKLQIHLAGAMCLPVWA